VSFLYFGPEVMMPLASAAAALLGGLMMFWRRVVGAAKAGARRLGRPFGHDPGDRDPPETTAAGPQRRKRAAKRRMG